MAYQNISLTRDGKTLILTLNRPTKLNALNLDTLAEIRQVIEDVYDDSATGGVIITGAGEKAFAAGADITEIASLSEMTARKFAERGQEIFFLIENCPKPIIAAINGYTLGAGCELAMACHMRVATAKARFGQPEVNLGLIPGYGGTQRLTQLVGKGKAMEMILTGDTMDAAQALQYRLVNQVVDNADHLIQTCRKILEKIYTKAPIAVGLAIDCINAVYAADDGYQTEANHFANCCRSEDFREGTAAFLEKRTPAFTNH